LNRRELGLVVSWDDEPIAVPGLSGEVLNALQVSQIVRHPTVLSASSRWVSNRTGKGWGTGWRLKWARSKAVVSVGRSVTRHRMRRWWPRSATAPIANASRARRSRSTLAFLKDPWSTREKHLLPTRTPEQVAFLSIVASAQLAGRRSCRRSRQRRPWIGSRLARCLGWNRRSAYGAVPPNLGSSSPMEFLSLHRIRQPA